MVLAEYRRLPYSVFGAGCAQESGYCIKPWWRTHFIILSLNECHFATERESFVLARCEKCELYFQLQGGFDFALKKEINSGTFKSFKHTLYVLCFTALLGLALRRLKKLIKMIMITLHNPNVSPVVINQFYLRLVLIFTRYSNELRLYIRDTLSD